MIKNHGVLIAPPRPRDYILGSTSKIVIDREIKDWSIYLPAVETQRTKVTDMLDCVSMSGPDHSIATQLNYLLSVNQLSDEALNFFHTNNYLVDGLFSISARFSACLNGTEKLKGQYLNVAADCVRRDGIAPEFLWPTHDDMDWGEFYKTPEQRIIDIAKKILWFVNIQWEWVPEPEIKENLKSAPMQVATAVCAGWDSGQIVQKCSGQPLQHATLIYAFDPVTGNWSNLDHYPPYKQFLARDYELPSNLRYVVTVKPLTLRKGMYGVNVLQLQKDLNKLGYILKEDKDFGPMTEKAVQHLQTKYKLVSDGIAGPLTLGKIKAILIPKTLVDAIIQVESGGDDNAEGDKTLANHAYGCLQIRQGVCDDVNSFFGTKFKAQDCLGHREVSIDIWNKYWKVYPLKVTNEDRSKTWNGGPGWKQRYFKVNKTPADIQYCKNLDIYWSKIIKLLNN